MARRYTRDCPAPVPVSVPFNEMVCNSPYLAQSLGHYAIWHDCIVAKVQAAGEDRNGFYLVNLSSVGLVFVIPPDRYGSYSYRPVEGSFSVTFNHK